MGENLTTPSASLPPLLEKEGSIISISPISRGLSPPGSGGVPRSGGVVNQVAWYQLVTNQLLLPIENPEEPLF